MINKNDNDAETRIILPEISYEPRLTDVGQAFQRIWCDWCDKNKFHDNETIGYPELQESILRFFMNGVNTGMKIASKILREQAEKEIYVKKDLRWKEQNK